jgi:hypothetical protein
MNVFRRLARLPLRLPLFQLRHLAAPAPAGFFRFTVAPIRAFAQFQRCSFSNAVESNVIGTAVYVHYGAVGLLVPLTRPLQSLHLLKSLTMR